MSYTSIRVSLDVDPPAFAPFLDILGRLDRLQHIFEDGRGRRTRAKRGSTEYRKTARDRDMELWDF